ncbi:hypothetical protein [Paraburkholderia sp. RL17-373-BIF-A]|uniref:hypothetical protein n=1 Tax=Paraburkholderia sp. RL17-373-BIF-A TaxID=3031629 RepID=UPI0038B97ECF
MPDLTDREVELLMRLRIERMCSENYPRGGTIDIPRLRSGYISELRAIYRPGEVNKDAETMLKEKSLTAEEEELIATKLNGAQVDYSTMFASFGHDAEGSSFCTIHPLVSYTLQYKSCLPSVDLEKALPGAAEVNLFVMQNSCQKVAEYKENKAAIDVALAKVFKEHGTLNIRLVGSARNDLS